MLQGQPARTHDPFMEVTPQHKEMYENHPQTMHAYGTGHLTDTR